jgi:hypothetical protein
MKKKENIWKYFDDTFEKVEDYEVNQPSKVLEYYGEALEEDMNQMLGYDIVFDMTSINSYPISLKSDFWITVPENKTPNGYRIRVFETSYPDKLYPCKLHCLLTENRYDCLSKEDLSEKILGEIKNERFKEKIYLLLLHFYTKEEIEKLRTNNESSS